MSRVGAAAKRLDARFLERFQLRDAMAKSKSAKASSPKASAKAEAKAKGAAKNEQLTLSAESLTPEPPAHETDTPGGPPQKSAPDRGQVVELVIGAKGAWKRLASGKKVPIDEKEWQIELGRLLAKKAQVENPSSEG